MINKIAFLFFLFIGLNFHLRALAQDEVRTLCFQFRMNNETIELGKKYYSQKYKDSIQIDQIKMYVSNIYFLSGNTIKDSVDKKYHLIDLEDSSTCSLTYQTQKAMKFNQIRFSIGIDSLTNVSGALGGDLDPTQGMYWAWQSGYINFKLEGKSDICSSRQHKFQFHLGGYQFPNNSFRTVEFMVSDSNPDLVIIAIDELFNKMDIKTNIEVMSPGMKSMEISDYLTKIISVQ